MIALAVAVVVGVGPATGNDSGAAVRPCGIRVGVAPRVLDHQRLDAGADVRPWVETF
jgi:hypothetical protein